MSSVAELFQHERWVVRGSIVNMLLFERFGREARPGRGAADLMREWSEADPDWLAHHVRAQTRTRGRRLLPRSWWTRRWARLRGLPPARLVARLPVAAAAAAFDALVFLAAIADVRRGRALRYWGRG